LGPDRFEEVQVLGKSYSTHAFTAKILPDRNLISDMIALEGNSWEEVSAAQYEDFVNFCREHYAYTGHFA